MRIGINGTGLVRHASPERVADDVARAEADGFSSYWLAEHITGGFDALTTLALAGLRSPGIELGTAVIPTYPRHPMVLAGQAITTNDVIGGRLTLGIGLSHQSMLAPLGLEYGKPIRHLKEYLSILGPLLADGTVDFTGEELSCTATLFKKPAPPCSIVVAALGPQALRVAGRLSDGTTLAWVGPKTIRDHIVPTISESAEKAGRPAPRIIATLPICVTDNPDAIRALAAQELSTYVALPSYQAMFEREGVDGPGDLVIAGSETEVKDRVADLAEAGVTDFAASEFTPSKDERARTRAVLVDIQKDQLA